MELTGSNDQPTVAIKKPRYLSPSSLSTWRENREEYVLKYLVDGIPKHPQTAAMAVGSSFDTYVKNALNRVLFGGEDIFEKLYEEQVEPQNRASSRIPGAVCFEAYKDSGAFDSLVVLLQKSNNVKVLFEKQAEGQTLSHDGMTVVMLGYPDLSFTYRDVFVTLDWKVNGFCSTSGVSPKPGHLDHKDCLYGYHGDVVYNAANHLERVEPSWATQLSTYAWMNGVPPGGQFLAMIEQLACSPRGIKIAKHRGFVTESYQKREFVDYCKTWEVVNSDHIFRDLSLEDSTNRVNMLLGQARVFNKDGEKYQWLKNALR